MKSTRNGALEFEIVTPSCTKPSRSIRDTEAERSQQIAGALLDHAGANPCLDVLAGALFDDDVVDAGPPQQVRQQHAGGAASDDRHLGAHGRTINEIDVVREGSASRDVNARRRDLQRLGSAA